MPICYSKTFVFVGILGVLMFAPVVSRASDLTDAFDTVYTNSTNSIASLGDIWNSFIDKISNPLVQLFSSPQKTTTPLSNVTPNVSIFPKNSPPVFVASNPVATTSSKTEIIRTTINRIVQTSGLTKTDLDLALDGLRKEILLHSDSALENARIFNSEQQDHVYDTISYNIGSSVTAIGGSTITDSSFSGGPVDATTLNVSDDTATSTFAGGIDVSSDGNFAGNIIATSFYGDASNLTGLSAASFSTTTTRSVFTAGDNLAYDQTNGMFSLATSTIVDIISSTIAGTTTDALVQGTINKYYSTDLFAGSLAGTTTTALAEGSNLYFTNNRVAAVIAGTTTSALAEGTHLYYTDTRVNTFVNASTTIPKTYTTNIFTGADIFNGNFTLSSLNGPLQANNGLVSATSSVGVLYGGTGLTSAPSYGNLLVGNSSGGYTLTATSSIGITSSQWITAGSNISYNSGNVGVGMLDPENLFTLSNLSSPTALKQSLLSVDQLQLGQLEGGSYFGRVGVKENQFGLNNFGNTWTAKDSSRNWVGIAMSSDGKIQTATAQGGFIYISSDYGNTWTAKDSVRVWGLVAISSDGKIQTATELSGKIYISSDYGNTWTAKDSNRSWTGVAMSSDGKIQTATDQGGFIYISTDYGNTWTAKDSNRSWTGVVMSSDGKIQTAAADSMYISTDYGNTWTAKDSNRNWISVAMSSDGKIQTATDNGGQIYVSTDYGNTWTAKDSNRNWISVAMSSDGKIQTATDNGGQIYVSTDYGNTWTAKDSVRGWQYVAMSSDGKIQTATDSSPGQIYVSYADSYINGNLGIGTTSPFMALSVAGQSFFTFASTTAFSSSGSSYFATNGTGNVGIGATTSPSKLFSVQGAGYISSNLFVGGSITSTSSSASIFPYASTTVVTSSGSAYFATNGTTNVVGVGATTSPWAQFSINPNAIGSAPAFVVGSSSATNFIITNAGVVGVGTTSPFANFAINPIAGKASNQFVVGSSTATAFIINNSGQVGVGTTSPFSTFSVNTVAGKNAFSVGSSTGTYFTVGSTGKVGVGTSSPFSTFSVNTVAGVNPFSVGSSTGTYFSIASTGKVGIATTSPWRTLSVNGSSDLGINALAGSFTATSSIASIFPYASTTVVTSSGSAYFATAGGSVGIASSTPWGLLSINSTGISGPAFVVGPLTNTNFIVASGGNVGVGISAPQSLLTVSNFASAGTLKASLFSTDQLQLGQLEGGSYFGRVGVKENQFDLNNFGNTWTNKGLVGEWAGVAMSSNGKIQTAVALGGSIYISSDYGNTWTAKDSSRNWRSVAMSSDGKIQTATVYSGGGQIYISSDYGNTWTAKDSNRFWAAVAMSSDGKIQTAAADSMYISTDYGNTWTVKGPAINAYDVAMSSDGKIQTAVVVGGAIYISSDYGNTWTAKDSNRSWIAVSMSSDGKIQTAVDAAGFIYISSDYGNTWSPKDSSRNWFDVTMSADGKIQTAVNYTGFIYTSSDYGNTWTAKGPSGHWNSVAMSSDGKIETVVGDNSTPIYVSYADSYTNGNFGIGTSSPYTTFSIEGNSALGYSALAGYFFATSTTASVFPYASTTALTISGTDGFTLANLNGPLQSNNGLVSATTSIGALYGGTGLTSAPSYGNLLVGNSSGGYTLTATSSLGITSSQWTTSGSDINYTLGNVGVGTSSPFSTFSVNTVSGVNPFSVGSSTGTYFTVGSTGKLGIGTANPNGQLEVYGNPAAGTTVGDFVVDSTNKIVYVGRLSTTAGDQSVFIVRDRNNVTHLSIDPANSRGNYSGNRFGIGSTSPFATFAINPLAGAASNQFVVGSSTGTSFIIDNGGKIGVGTSSPAAGGIEIVGSYNPASGAGTESNYALMLHSTSTTVGVSTGLGFQISGGNGVAGNITYIRQGASSFGDMTFAVTPSGGAITERMRITSTGAIGIGSTSPSATLAVNPIAGGALNQFAVGSSTKTSFLIDNASNITIGNYLNCTALTTTASGVLQCTVSDERMKQNIQTLDKQNGLDAIDSLNAVSFNWRDSARGDRLQYGFIAQQVQKIFPNLVATSSPTALTPDGTLSVDYIGLIAPSIEAIQELHLDLKAIISDSASSTIAASFATSFWSAVTVRVSTWLADATNGIKNIFADKVTTKTLCVGATCVTEDQLKALLDKAGQSSVPVVSTSVQSTIGSSSSATSSADSLPIASSTSPTDSGVSDTSTSTSSQ